jgi:hypothetical protein
MEPTNKSKLTGGTLFVIALIVLFFGNATARWNEKKLEEIHKAVLANSNELHNLRIQIRSLKVENTKLKEKIDVTGS